MRRPSTIAKVKERTISPVCPRPLVRVQPPEMRDVVEHPQVVGPLPAADTSISATSMKMTYTDWSLLFPFNRKKPMYSCHGRRFPEGG